MRRLLSTIACGDALPSFDLLLVRSSSPDSSSLDSSLAGRGDRDALRSCVVCGTERYCGGDGGFNDVSWCAGDGRFRFGADFAGSNRRFTRGRAASVTVGCPTRCLVSRGCVRRSSELLEVCTTCFCRLRGATPAGRSLSKRLAMYLQFFAGFCGRPRRGSGSPPTGLRSGKVVLLARVLLKGIFRMS